MIATLAMMALAASPLEDAMSLAPPAIDDPPGTWVEYAVSIGSGRPLFVRLSVLGEEAVGAGRGTWLELWLSARPGSATQVYRALLAGDPHAPGTVRRVLARLGGGAVTELPASAFADVHLRAGARAQNAHARASRTTTPAGTFVVREVVAPAGRGRLRLEESPEVPLGGVVRLEVNGLVAELHGMGRDGESGIPADAEVRPLPERGSR